MHYRSYLVCVTIALIGIGLAVLGIQATQAAGFADASLSRTYTVSMTYVPSDNYQNRLVNSKATFDRLQEFLDKVTFAHGRTYSFLRDVLHNSMVPDEGFVNTEKGYAYGACGASSLLNKLVQTSTFRDKTGKEQPVFRTLLVWTWTGDKTYGKYGATIYLDFTGQHKTKDYIWKLNEAYNGPSPRITSFFNMDTGTVTMTMVYADEPPPGTAPTPSPTPTSTSTSTPTNTPTVRPTTRPTDRPTATVAPTATSSLTPTSMPERIMADPNQPVRSDLTSRVRAQHLAAKLQAIIGERRFGVSVIPLGLADDVMDEVGVNQEMQLFVASAFKGPVAMYFFENVDRSVWNGVPVRYWPVKDQSQVPDNYRADWLKYHDVLRDLYWMAVYSENEATGNILMYVYQTTDWHTRGENALVAFNNWSHEHIGITGTSGIHLWLSGATNCSQCVDDRYGHEIFIYGTKVLVPNNTYSPRDLALFYRHLATEGRTAGYYDVATELLSTLIPEPGMLKTYSRQMNVQSASKDGFVGPYSEYSDGFYISTDAGLLTLSDGSQYAVAFMAFDAGDLLAASITTTLQALLETSQDIPISAIAEF